MVWIRFCGFAWHFWTPPVERVKFSGMSVAMNLVGLAVLWAWATQEATHLGSPLILLIGGWACSLGTAIWVERNVPAIPFLLKSRQAAHLKAVAIIPFIAAFSLLPCALFQWAFVGFTPNVGPLLYVEWEIACGALVLDLVLCGFKNLFT